MGYSVQRIAFYTALKYGLNSSIPIRFDSILDNDPITTSGNLWVKCHIEPMETFQHSIGTSNPLERTPGLLIVNLYDREKNGYADILRQCDVIKDIFLRKSFDSGRIRINKVQIKKKGENISSFSKVNSHNNWISYVVIVLYTADE